MVIGYRRRIMDSFDIIVVGGGHAGCEAAAAAARTGARVALVSFDRTTIGAMSCNPAIGGLGKGHLVREVDAFDGIIARAADHAAIHYRMLNASKGAAVQGPRIQADRARFKASVHEQLAALPSLTIVEGEAASLRLDGRRVTGLELGDGRVLTAPAVVLATGTFLNAVMFCGDRRTEGGRVRERAASRLGQQLRVLDLPIARMKTGTPPRIDGRTIDWAALEEQPSDGGDWTMSAMGARVAPQLFCAITRTNARTHAIIRDAFDRSPLFAGAIEGRGPRYCPSIEDKVHRFGDRDGHQVFLEPEGLRDHVVYPNGISTSLPADVQLEMVRSMAGLTRAAILEPGYAVEYDHVDPRILGHDLAVRGMDGLYCAGQINGTTGYEEAAAQGLIAGLNAAAWIGRRAPVIPDRACSYIGVMIDDLVLQGVTEPYRMLTARAEYRLRLRADNAETRLSALARAARCVSPGREAHLVSRETALAEARALLDTIHSAAVLFAAGARVRDDGVRRSLFDWLRFPEVDAATLIGAEPRLADTAPSILGELVEDGRYAPYLVRQEAEIATLRRDEDIAIPLSLDFARIAGLSNEMVERLELARPATLAEASRIRGITPAALSAILVHSRRRAA